MLSLMLYLLIGKRRKEGRLGEIKSDHTATTISWSQQLRLHTYMIRTTRINHILLLNEEIIIEDCHHQQRSSPVCTYARYNGHNLRWISADHRQE